MVQFDLDGNRLPEFPQMRFMGNKQKLLDFIGDKTKTLDFDSVFDAFAGSGTVSHQFKTESKRVISNDILEFSYHVVNATVENSGVRLSPDEVDFLVNTENEPSFIQSTFEGLYYTDEENAFLDRVRTNIDELSGEYEKSIALAALCRACQKKRPRGIFTYTGLDKYRDGRRDLEITMEQQFRENVEAMNSAVFDNQRQNVAHNEDVFSINADVDLVYMDPPYVSKHSDNRYLRRYHFIEGLCSYWENVEIDHSTKTKKINRREGNPFNHKQGIRGAFNELFSQYQDSIIVVSYSSNSIPGKEEMAEMLSEFKSSVEVHTQESSYQFGNSSSGSRNDDVDEYIFIGK
jgi:DNA adenine methylase